ncbi:translation initiation factor IF-2 [Candidatus Nomurabacteria bacterium RIFCSPLOWO2_02_FULL_44_12]|uniref:Translation initiation factor IF-2 n=1 Tax=Candidatus Nomurabacteria bacterium RIFCSPLOWO2_12_FULL_44_11 TaxID=1801796 RepID=A0A1F6Y801_9BACT|nr:MAG: translation initiation factor IF-2 [Candidatus Nomurabacteria bacterium RIFCSPHIGHO2_12_FULL_44_22b]OGJ02466.1 MAG: translation initiation factor IF-2 [Candidatus Nomurabacteria bacterium RIFCSPLOWO2_12_FULL_44_11]OGJ07301.1 MAG: translation initiation factor IF-2 [Candidatus Nomurabacteria bacterium RIFCSPLOWO2_02_FULL_44_12]
MEKKDGKQNIVERAPVVVVMGHIDHGKSTLLDYIRKTNIVEKEAGSITQHISAYEVEVPTPKEFGSGSRPQASGKITFLDTPGHEAFSKMRARGAEVADIAILVVSAEDGVKPQTIEAWKTIVESNTPAIVAINKIDKPGANVEKTKTQLAENEIYLENYGGKVPFALISAKTGEGVDSLLSLILILAQLESFIGSPAELASGYVIESSLDPKRGVQATLIIKNGTLKKGLAVAASDSICSTRIIENFRGEVIDEATFSSPIRLVGWDKIPEIGSQFKAFDKKREAEECVKNWKTEETPARNASSLADVGGGKKIIPVVLKADVAGSLEVIVKEIEKIKNENAEFKITHKGTGPITESDIKNISAGENVLVVGFNVKADKSATETAFKRGITISHFDIIYKLTEWLAEEMEKRRPRVETEETTGRAKILKAFSRTKERQIVGGKVIAGAITLGSVVKIMRREFEIGKGKIINLEKNKEKIGTVPEGAEFGMMIESKIEIVGGDVLESFSVVQK